MVVFDAGVGTSVIMVELVTESTVSMAMAEKIKDEKRILLLF